MVVEKLTDEAMTTPEMKPCPNPWCARMWQSYHKIELKNWRLEELFDKWGYVCSCCGTASPVCATKELALEAWNHRPEPFVDCVRCGKALGLSNIRCE